MHMILRYRCLIFGAAAAVLGACSIPFSVATRRSAPAAPKPAPVPTAAPRIGLELGDRALRHGRLSEAEVELSSALARAENDGRRDAALAAALDAMGDLREAQGDAAGAEIYDRRALAVWEECAGPDAPETGAARAYLAGVCAAQGRSAEAEALLLRAVTSAQTDPARAEEAAARLDDLGGLERSLGRLDAAEADYRRALAFAETADGAESLSVARRLDALALFEHSRGLYDAAEPMYRRALEIKEKRLGPGDGRVLAALDALALFEEARGRDAEAEALYRRAVDAGRRADGTDADGLKSARADYAHLLRRLGRGTEADALDARSVRPAQTQPEPSLSAPTPSTGTVTEPASATSTAAAAAQGSNQGSKR